MTTNTVETTDTWNKVDDDTYTRTASDGSEWIIRRFEGQGFLVSFDGFTIEGSFETKEAAAGTTAERDEIRIACTGTASNH